MIVEPAAEDLAPEAAQEVADLAVADLAVEDPAVSVILLVLPRFLVRLAR